MQSQKKSEMTEKQDLMRELAALRDKVAKMEARARRLGWFDSRQGGMRGKQGMSAMGEKRGMGKPGSKDKMSGMGKPGSKDKMSGMGKPGSKDKMSGMDEMGGKGKMDGMGKPGSKSKMGGMGEMGMAKEQAEKGMGMRGQKPATTTRPASLPAHPEGGSDPSLSGVAHILHVGATDFFLDQREHLGLTTSQAERLAMIQTESAQATSTFDLQIEEAEQRLWILTGAADPALDKIRLQAKAIADLGAEERVAFIQAVMKAVRILTPEQHDLLRSKDLPEANENPKVDENPDKEGR